MVGHDVPKCDTSKKLVFKSIEMKTLNMAIMKIMLYRLAKYRRDSNVGKVIS